MVMPKVPAAEQMTDPIAASEEGPRESGVVQKPSLGMIFFVFLPFFSMLSFANIFFVITPADLPQDFNDFEPSMDATFDDASD